MDEWRGAELWWGWPLAFDRCVGGRDVEARQVLVQVGVGGAMGARRPGVDHHRAWLLLTRGRRWRVVETLDTRQPRHLARGELAGRSGLVVVGGLVVRQATGRRALSVAGVSARVPGSPPVLQFGLGVASAVGEDGAGGAAEHASTLGER